MNGDRMLQLIDEMSSFSEGLTGIRDILHGYLSSKNENSKLNTEP